MGKTYKTSVNSTYEFDIKDDVSSFDIGLGLGIGYKFDISENAKLFVHYQGYNGFIDVIDGFDFSLKNATSAFNLGVEFNL